MKRYICTSSDGNWMNTLTSEEKDTVEKSWDAALKELGLDVAYHENTDSWLIIKNKKVLKEVSDFDRMEKLQSLYKKTDDVAELTKKIKNWLK